MTTKTTPSTPLRPTADGHASHRRALFAAVACNVLEFFDFVTYAFFALQIGRAFFPATDPSLSLMFSVAVFGVGFFARPLGSVIVGYYADRRGRKPALLLTAALMTCGTLGLALAPAYASIGIAAPIIVTASRLLQGFALGGEIGPSTAFLLEMAAANRRASYVSLQLLSQGAATVLAGLLALGLSTLLDPVEMEAWGWRVPFVVGALLVPAAFVLRATMPETLRQGGELPEHDETSRPARQGVYLIASMGVIAGGSVATYVGNYMASYATAVLKLPPTAGMRTTVAVGVATMVGALAGGQLADAKGRWPVMFWSRAAAAVLTVPAFLVLTAQRDTMTLLAVSALLAFLTAMNGSGALTTICELYSRQRRATALALIYSVGVSLFGGTTQFVVTWLTAATGSPIAPAWYVVTISAIAVLATLQLPETRPISLTQQPPMELQPAKPA